jgi:5-methylcytosine-specific restriction protein B
VRFVTFHQSFSYEDFVEGIRALPSEGDDQTGGVIRYDVEPGIFRKLCEDAVRDKAYEHKVGVREHARVWKISIDDAGPSETRNYCFEHGEARIGWQYVGDIRNANLADPAHKLGTNDQSSLNMFGNEILPGDILLCLRSKTSICGVGVVTGEYRFDEHQESHLREDFVHVLPVRWLAKHINFDILTLNGDTSLTQKTVYPLARIKWPALQQALQDADIALEAAHSTAMAATAHQPHVLIIDEINRGNVSRIFGELITLLEPSKRAGAVEALHVQLPYSKAQFSVPSNVYLIGTMNTADRSLVGLDIALRRRFSFKEMPPQPELLREVTVNEINIADLLSAMNERIEVLLGRDHCLGHAYFMPLKKERTMERLASIFRNQVLPLLQEYFFEDWQRIQWVLNDHRKPDPADRFVFQTKADLGALFGDKVPVSTHNMPWRINQLAFTRASAYRGLIAAMQQTAVPVSELETVTP